MKLVIRILEVTYHTPFLIHEWSGRQFIFTWSKEHGAYVYVPKDEREAETILSTPRSVSPWLFMPKYIPEPGDANPEALALKDAEIARLKEQIVGLKSEIDGLQTNEKELTNTVEGLLLRNKDLEAKLATATAKPKKREQAPKDPVPVQSPLVADL